MKDEKVHHPLYGGRGKLENDPHWRCLILFYENFHRDNGAGLGASHQTGQKGQRAKMIELFRRLNPEEYLEAGKGVGHTLGEMA